MTWSKEFVELDKLLHDRPTFDCGEPTLNTFIQTQAAKHMQIGISRTMLLPGSTPLPNGKYPICAFYKIAPSSIKSEHHQQTWAKKLPRYPVPVFLQAQLAVHREYQKKWLGKVTLTNSLEYLWGINSHMRALAIVVDCLNENAKMFYLKYGFELMHEFTGKIRMFIPMNVVAKLFDRE